MNIKEMRSSLNLSQRQFADLFDIPLAQLQDWENGRINTPEFMLNIIHRMLQHECTDESYIKACNERRLSVERALAILLTATEGPNQEFMNVLASYIAGELSLDEMDANVDQLKYVGM